MLICLPYRIRKVSLEVSDEMDQMDDSREILLSR